MKSKSLLLSVAAISLSCVHWAAQAGSAVFYITEDGSVAEGVSVDAVSYTHLTLPTIYSV